ncbi:MAG: c-type cytochrome [Candidatus Thiodiazotropha weberae]|nr:c-type cytochrome [Candidatus Thiodiazotropha weberae]MCG7901701.1 c-type cytochrome [Candidatus Thiodiazotropha weberae]MCG7913935.1 c-type cytochrome [Candidatus Thiodiazotropha weberae]
MDGKGYGPLAKKMKIEAEDLTDYVPTMSDYGLQVIITGDKNVPKSLRSRHGKISKDMPKWKEVLNQSQISALIAYLRFLSTTKHDLPGDPELGYELYQRYCSICHGVEGVGDGALTNLIGVVPIDLTNPGKTDDFSNKTLTKDILEGKGDYMPGWKGILTNEEVDGLVSYIRLLYQVWAHLEDGGLVVVMNSPTLENNKDRTTALLNDTSCSSKANLSVKGKAEARKVGKLFKSRGVRVEQVLSSPYCLAKETALTAFGQAETHDYLASNEKLSSNQADNYAAELDTRIGSYEGKGNLVIFTHDSIIKDLSFQKLKDGYFLVLKPMGKNEYEEIGVYKMNR